MSSTPPVSDPVRTGSWLRPALLLGLFVLVVHILLSPSELYPGDPFAWFLEARTIAHEGTLALPAEQTNYGAGGQFFVRNPRNGLLYSKYGLGSSLSVLPAFVAARVGGVEAGRHLVLLLNLEYAVVSAVLAVLLYALARRYVTDGAAALFVLACMYGTFLWQYQRSHTMELFLCLYFAAWFWALLNLRETGKWRWLLLAWCAAAMLVITRVTFLPMIPITALIVAWIAPRTAARIVGGAVLPAACCLIVIGAINFVKFGAWLEFGYSQWRPDQSAPSWRNWRNLYAFVVDPHFSPLITFPILTFALLRWSRFWREHRGDAIVALLGAMPIYVVYLLTPNWKGAWAEGPRYFLFALPILALPFALLLADLRGCTTRPARLCGAALLIAVLGWTAVMQFLVLSRPFLAYHRIIAPMGISDDWLCVVQPRGLILMELHQAMRNRQLHPLLASAKDRLPPEQFIALMRVVDTESRPSNLYWLQQ